MALSKDIVIRLLGDADSAVKAQKAAAEAAGVAVGAYRRAEREFDKQQKAMEAASRKQRAAMEEVGTAATGFGLAMAAGLGLAAKAAMDWESSWAGVTKTVSGTDAELAEVEKGLRDLTSVLPASHTEIAAVAEAAGQLGVQTPSIVEFTRTMVNLGETTNLTSEEAATSLAQLMNVMRTSPDDVGRLGASLVALGNAGASTEADILKMASYLSGAASLIGASESDVLALSNALTGMGVNAERGGGVMTRVMQDIYSAVQMGGDELEGFAQVAGMSSAEFARAFEADPIRAIAAFTDGLGKAKGSGENVVAMLNELGYKGTQDTAVLLQLASAQGEVTKDLDLGNTAWEQNTALVEEAAKRYDTTAAKLEIARNGITEAGIEIGEALLPVLAEVAGAVADVAQWFADLPGPVQDVLAVLGSVAAAGGLVGAAFLILVPRVLSTIEAFRTLRDTSPGVASGLGKIGKAAGIAGIVLAAAGAIDALTESMSPAPASMEATTAALVGMGSSFENVDALFSDLSSWGYEIDGVAGAAQKLADPGLLNRLNDFGAELFSLGSAEGSNGRERLIEQFGHIGTSLGLMVQNGNAKLAAEQFELLAAEWERGGGSVEDLKNLMPGYTEALLAVENQQALAAQSATGMADAVGTIAPTVESTYGSLAGYATALGLDEDATQELIKKTEELGTTLADFVNPLGLYTTMLGEKAAAEEEAARKAAESAGASAESWREFVVDTGFSFDAYMERLREQVTAQENWKTNMLLLAGEVSQGTLDELARMGPEGAPLVAELVTKSDAELADFDTMMAARAKDATDAWGAEFTMATPVLAEITRKFGKEAADAAAQELRAGTKTLAQVAGEYNVAVAGGLNPLLRSLGKPGINISDYGFNSGGGYAEGGYTGPGGKYDPAGIVHAGEYVLTKEETSRLGIQRIEEFANRGYATGGFVTPTDVPRPRSTAPARPPISLPAEAAMEKAYAEATAWLTANVGTAGSGQLGSGVAGMFAAVKRQFPEARLNSGFRPGDPGYHGLGRAIDLGQIGRAGGNGHPYLAAMNRWLHDSFGANLAELIYTGAGDDRPDLKNGRPLTYSAGVRNTHRNHVHVAMADGGIIGEPVVGRGLRTGDSYSFGERGPETVMPGVQVGASASRTGVAAPIVVKIVGATVGGTLDLGDGLTARLEGVVVDAIESVTQRGDYTR